MQQTTLTRDANKHEIDSSQNKGIVEIKANYLKSIHRSNHVEKEIQAIVPIIQIQVVNLYSANKTI